MGAFLDAEPYRLVLDPVPAGTSTGPVWSRTGGVEPKLTHGSKESDEYR